MRILITTGIFPPDLGGPASYVPLMASALTKRNHDVRVLTYGREERKREPYLPFLVERIPASPSMAYRIGTALGRLHRHVRWADLVFVNGLLIESAWISRMMNRPAIAKIVGDLVWERARAKGWTADSFDRFQRNDYGPAIRSRRFLRRKALDSMGAVIVPSLFMKRVLQGWGIRQNEIHVVHNAAPFTNHRPEPALIPLSQRKKVVTVARLVSWKGVAGLIESLAPLEEIGLVVVGDGPEREPLRDLVRRMNMMPRVHFAGAIPHEEVASHLVACDLFVLNSLSDPFPHALLEALSVDLPIVATRTGGIPEIVEGLKRARLVPVGDSSSLREAIQEMLSPSQVELSPAVPQRFTAAGMIRETTALMEAVAARRVRR